MTLRFFWGNFSLWDTFLQLYHSWKLPTVHTKTEKGKRDPTQFLENDCELEVTYIGSFSKTVGITCSDILSGHIEPVSIITNGLISELIVLARKENKIDINGLLPFLLLSFAWNELCIWSSLLAINIVTLFYFYNHLWLLLDFLMFNSIIKFDRPWSAVR